MRAGNACSKMLFSFVEVTWLLIKKIQVLFYFQSKEQHDCHFSQTLDFNRVERRHNQGFEKNGEGIVCWGEHVIR